MMKIMALIQLILEINKSVDFLNLIPNVEEHNLECVVELNIAIKKNLDQYGNTGTRIRSSRIDRRTRSSRNLSRGTRNSLKSRPFKMYFKKLVKLPFN